MCSSNITTLTCFKITPFEKRLYFLLAEELNNSMTGLTNIQNEGNECFRWCLVRSRLILETY